MSRFQNQGLLLLLLVLTFAAGVCVGRLSWRSAAPLPETPRSVERPERQPRLDRRPSGRSVAGTSHEATVTYIFDGDSMEVMLDGHRKKVRMIGIDAPEKNQPFADQARRHLRRLCDDRSVELSVHGRDQYDRLLAEVILNGVNLNRQMVREGYAWSYDRQDHSMLALEQEARRARRGLWQDPLPIRPSEWRDSHD
jgi:endonuclease YncB( thermonuclease family)